MLRGGQLKNLVLQGELNQEKAKTRVLRNRLTNLEAEYYALLDQLQPSAPGTPDQSEAAAAAGKGLGRAHLEAIAGGHDSSNPGSTRGLSDRGVPCSESLVVDDTPANRD